MTMWLFGPTEDQVIFYPYDEYTEYEMEHHYRCHIDESAGLKEDYETRNS